jgi:hypothetical protein
MEFQNAAPRSSGVCAPRAEISLLIFDGGLSATSPSSRDFIRTTGAEPLFENVRRQV